MLPEKPSMPHALRFGQHRAKQTVWQSARQSAGQPARRVVKDRGDPLAAVYVFGRRITRMGLLIGFAVAIISHGVFGGQALAGPTEMRLWAQWARKDIHDYLWSTYDIDLLKPSPVEEKEEAKEEKDASKDDVRPPPPSRAAHVAAPAVPPPPAAQAGKVLTARADPDAPVDLTGDGFVTGDAETFVGGVTAAAGVGTVATQNEAAAVSTKPRGSGTGSKAGAQQSKPTVVDKSRAATIATGANWSSCPFPPEANADQIDFAVVTLIVMVRPDGTPRSVQVVSDPGHGFGRAARMCALSKRYSAALDSDGNAMMATTPPIRVTFTR